MKRNLEIYIHIPFCVKKCDYCDFLSAPAGREQQEAYVQALIREIEAFPQKEQYRISSIFFGGGTPSLLSAKWIVMIMELLKREFYVEEDAEITLECNPGTADLEKLRAYHDCGINRLSFGLQSANDEELQLLGRIHTWDTFVQTYQAARQVGFSNINIDLMSALPGQTVESWCKTLKKVLQLSPEHISAYSLIIEEGTPFFSRYGEDAKRREQGEDTLYLPSEDAEREMYQLTQELLLQAGLKRYEISNYALDGYACRHNIGYWDGTEYVGFGLGASSMLYLQKEAGERSGSYWRIRNTEHMESYLECFKPEHAQLEVSESCQLSKQDRMEEFMFLGLRLTAGVSECEFEQRFSKTLDDVYGTQIQKQVSLGLLERQDGRIRLTARGIDVSNAVMAEFLFDECS